MSYIYVASSWRNEIQPEIVRRLRSWGHHVYDFRNPPGGTDFAWSAIDPNWEQWTPEQWREALDHPLALRGYVSDMSALRGCDTCLLVLPCGRSAHLELGWAAGAGKRTVIYVPVDHTEPELMVKMCDKILIGSKELQRFFE